jgi:TolB protein
MKRTLMVFILFGIILAMAGGLLYWWGTPTLVAVSPEAGATNVPAGAPLRLTFSRPLQAASLEGRLSTDPPLAGKFFVEGNDLVFTPELPWPSGQAVHVGLASGARAAGWLPLPMRQAASWSFTTGQPQLVYLYPSSGRGNLYVRNLQTGESKALTDVDGEVLDYTISANGTKLYYSVSQGDGGSALFVVDRLSGTSTRLLDCPQALCRAPHVSPKGDTLAYERTELATAPQAARPQVRLLDLQSGDTRPVGDSSHSTEGPSWSATGLLAYYDADLAAFVLLNIQTGESIRLSNQTGLSGAWDPAGERFIMADIFLNPVSTASDPSVQPMQSSRLILYQQASGRSDDLSGADDLEDTGPIFSPDGAWLAFARKYLDLTRWTPGRQLWIMRADGTEPRALTQDPQYNHYDIAWSPTGQQLAYVRFNQTLMTEPPEVWTISLDGTRAERQVVGGYSPQWLP